MSELLSTLVSTNNNPHTHIQALLHSIACHMTLAVICQVVNTQQKEGPQALAHPQVGYGLRDLVKVFQWGRLANQA
jgi:hypothetical protein